jgi:phage-related protein
MQGDKIILLHGILKKSAKPPQRDLDTAKARMKDMKERGL